MFRLAGHLGKTVAELGDTMTVEEFFQWIAFDQLSPIGGERFDVLFTLLRGMWAGKGATYAKLAPPWTKPGKRRSSTSEEILVFFRDVNTQQERKQRGNDSR